ncbi:hypothetical protein J19TS2_55630 [Cohnella xylanilytica]|uniref:Alpha/beta hydrolase n=1 Tax=Cohnella xylanilytica TaxID=557555 RepID=A0A841TXL4_9BACL|nr:alpha/beta hydrolase [Cohnella xylanilytica]MBB6690384.1 alpha/beta hydrolase [Cohnella xylanilytica]GIO16008.1 hypothetical protein J19TS2_55630 [Cohnella xylanilytica]
MNRTVTLQDGSKLEVGLTGAPSGPVVMLPGAKRSVFGQEADSLRAWGVDPELGRRLVEGLSDEFRVLHFDYETHLFENPRPDRLTPDALAADLLHIADATDVGTFSYYGYSWLALAGLQLAIRTDRLDSLIMGGYPPYEGPYREMLIVTEKTYEQALRNRNVPEQPPESLASPDEIDWNNVRVTIAPDQTKQFYTLYRSLTDFNDKAVQDRLKMPRLAFAGEKDTIVYGESFGSVTVDIGGIARRNQEKLESLGWDVAMVEGPGMDHTRAMQPAAVLPLIKPWLMKHLLSR